MNEIEILTNTPNGPVVEYPADASAEDVEAAVGENWSVDWDTPAVKLASGRYRAPLIAAVHR